MASSENLEFPFDTNSLFFLDGSETCSALTDCQENPSLVVSDNNEHNESVGLGPVSAATNDVYPSSLVENSLTDHQEAITRTSSFGHEAVTQNQSFRHEGDYSSYFNAAETFPNMPSYASRNVQRESVYSENYFVSSTGLQSIGLQHAPLSQSYHQPQVSQTVPNFYREPYVPTMMGSNVQEVERTNGLTNLNPIYGRQDHHFRPSLFQEEYDQDLLFQQLKNIHQNDQMQQPELPNMSIPPGPLLSNQQQIPYGSASNPENRLPMISNPHILNKSDHYSPLGSPYTHTSYQSDPVSYNFQKSSSSKPTRRARGRPRKNPIAMPLVPTTQTSVISPRHYGTQDKGKQPVTAMPSLNPNLYNQRQNPYTNTMIQQSGVFRQRSCYDQLENESPSSKLRRIMPPVQESSVPNSSMVSFWQDGNMRPSAANPNEERSIKNTIYDPLYAGVGLPIDPHLRLF